MLGVFGLSLYTGEKELRDFFSKYGPMEDLKVIYDHQTGKSRGFAFIYYEDIEDAIDVSSNYFYQPYCVKVYAESAYVV